MPTTRRAFGESDALTLELRLDYARVFYEADGATIGDICEAINTLVELESTARHIFGNASPLVDSIERALLDAKITRHNREREAPLPGSV